MPKIDLEAEDDLSNTPPETVAAALEFMLDGTDLLGLLDSTRARNDPESRRLAQERHPIAPAIDGRTPCASAYPAPAFLLALPCRSLRRQVVSPVPALLE